MRDSEYIKQVIWGTSLKMAKDEEIQECYDIIKGYLEANTENYAICDQAKLKKIEPKRSLFGASYSMSSSTAWLCGMMYSGSDLCDKAPSTTIDNIQAVVEKLVPDESSISAQDIVDVFTDAGYAAVYPCNKIFLIK